MHSASTRLLPAAGALALGVAFSFAMYRWQMPYTRPSPAEAHAWAFTSIPFAGLAVLIVLGLRRSASVLGWIVLAALTAVAFVVAAHVGTHGSFADNAMILQILYGAVFLVHLRAHDRRKRPEESTAPMKTNTKTPRTLGIILLVCTGIALIPSTPPWDPGAGHAIAFGVAFAAPLWLSAAFALSQWARGRARSETAAWAWFFAALLGLLVLFVEVASTQPVG